MLKSGIVRISTELENEINKVHRKLKEQGLRVSKVEISRMFAKKLRRGEKLDIDVDFRELNIKL